MQSRPKSIVFDAYGTLFDVHSVLRTAVHGIAGDLEALSNLWRRNQLEYTWLLALMERFQDFRQITEMSLRASARQIGISVTEDQVGLLMKAYLSPARFPEVRSTLQSLSGIPLAILSNGTTDMVTSAVANSGLTSFFDHVISVDRVGTYKPSPRVYALGPEILRFPAADILFVSANGWDAAGAKSYGYQVCWCNRSNAVQEDLGFTPDFVITALDQITRI